MWQIFKFELKYRASQPSTYFFFLVLFAFSFLFVATNIVQVGGGGDNIFFNSPFTIARVTAILAATGTMMISAIVGTAVYRDFEVNVHELFFTTPLKKFDYLIGRFAGSYLWALVIFSGILFGLFVGAHMPWVDQTRIGPFHFSYYWQPFIVFVVPDVLFLSCFVFTLGMLTRSLLAIYAQGILIFIGYSIALSMVRNLDNRTVASLIDAFGITPLTLTTRYWTQFQRNTLTVHFDGYLLWNRLLWMGIGLAVLAVGYSLFTFSSQARTLLPGKKSAINTVADDAPTHAIDLSSLKGAVIAQDAFGQFRQLVKSYFTESTRRIAFIMIAGFGIVNIIINASFADQIEGTSVYPVTRIMLDQIFGSFILFFVILITVYAGELTWKERDLKLDQVQDALPTPTWVAYAAKLTTVLCMMLVLLAALALAGIGIQISKGYYNFELGLYASYLLLYAFPMLILFTVGAFFVHGVVNNKFLGHVVVIASFVASLALPSAGLEHHLFIYASGPNLQLSDMNGYGPYVAPIFWFYAYWFAFAGLLAIATLLLWVRGTETSAKLRLAIARQRIDGRVRVSAAFCLVAFIALGGFIYYNTCVLNVFRTSKQQKQLTADYEKTYKHWETVPMPRITDATIRTDIYPDRRQFDIAGSLKLVNKHDQPLSDIYVSLNPELTVRSVAFDQPSVLTKSDKNQGVYIYHLATPLAPGQAITLNFDTPYTKTGFRNDKPMLDIVNDGTFLTGYVPEIGYQPNGEMTSDVDRRKYHLPPRAPMHPIGDMAARQNTYISNDSDWINLDTTLSTSADQIAIAPGYLQKEWTVGDRRYFHYKMDAPIRNFYTFLSGRYLVARDKWRNVNIEIYYDKQHPYNVQRMIDGVKAALAYDSANFSPYQYRQMRIIEFPAYQDFAQSFANTVPYSEGIGFIARVRDEKSDVDLPFYVTCHEVSHQWWAHQLLGADCQGSEMMAESFAQYSALMIMKHTYGDQQMRKFLKYQLDEYLNGRAGERHQEQPLYLTEDEPYIHYNKGSLVMYELQDQIGEDKVNLAMHRMVVKYGFQNPPYCTSLDFLAILRQVAPPDKQQVITDLFQKITLYNNRAISATYKQIGPNKYHVTLVVQAEKMYADGKGAETPTPIHDVIDIGVLAKPTKTQDIGNALYLQKTLITQPTTTIQCDVTGLPDKAGIDPYCKLIDKVPDDNTMTVGKE